jgi:dephospho-CoA kinase
MIKVGLTGNIGSGKSLVAGIFGVLGIPVFSADEAGRKVLEIPEFVQRISAQFGQDILDTEGRIIRAALAGKVFHDKSALQQLNSIVHPEVRKLWLSFAESFPDKPYVLHEAAILIESGFHQMLDRMVLVTAPLEIRKERVLQRDQISEEAFLARASAQWSEARKRPYASYVIDNSGELPLIPQVLDIHRALTSGG